MSETAALALLIDAPMQSWGVNSRYQHRGTEAFPSKSAILGLIAAACGIDKFSPDEADFLLRLKHLRMSQFLVPRPTAGRRALLVQRLTDFHTVGGGYDASHSPLDKLSIPRKASGSPFGTVITHRTYLTDARFICTLKGDKQILTEILPSLQNPCWGVWFGRKACIPAMPLSAVIDSDEMTAASHLLQTLKAFYTERQPHTDSDTLPLDIQSLLRWEEPEASETLPSDFQLADQPLSFGRREFEVRPVRRVLPTDNTKRDSSAAQND